MKCTACQHELVKATRTGQTLLQTRGLLLKGGTLVCICPNCKADVPASPEVLDTLHTVFFRAKPAPQG